MKDKLKNEIVLIAIVFIIGIIITLCLYPFLPEQLPMQFDMQGNTNYTLPKIIGAFAMPLILLAYVIYMNFTKGITIQTVAFTIILFIVNFGFLGFIILF